MSKSPHDFAKMMFLELYEEGFNKMHIIAERHFSTCEREMKEKILKRCLAFCYGERHTSDVASDIRKILDDECAPPWRDQ